VSYNVTVARYVSVYGRGNTPKAAFPLRQIVTSNPPSFSSNTKIYKLVTSMKGAYELAVDAVLRYFGAVLG